MGRLEVALCNQGCNHEQSRVFSARSRQIFEDVDYMSA
jgi:hypothetical protein